LRIRTKVTADILPQN